MGIIIAIGTLFIFSKYLDSGLEKALTISMTTLVVFQWLNAWNCKSERRSLFSVNLFNNLYLVGATVIVITLQLFAIYTPFLQKILHTVPLNLFDWIFVISIAFSIIVFEEIKKFFTRQAYKNFA